MTDMRDPENPYEVVHWAAERVRAGAGARAWTLWVRWVAHGPGWQLTAGDPPRGGSGWVQAGTLGAESAAQVLASGPWWAPGLVADVARALERARRPGRVA